MGNSECGMWKEKKITENKNGEFGMRNAERKKITENKNGEFGMRNVEYWKQFCALSRAPCLPSHSHVIA